MKVIDDDCFRPGLLEGQGAFDVYLYDGDHTVEAHRLAWTLFARHLADEAIVVIDDWNSIPIQEGTEQGLREIAADFAVRHRFVIKYTADGSHTHDTICHNLFWNGIAIFVVQRIKPLALPEKIILQQAAS